MSEFFDLSSASKPQVPATETSPSGAVQLVREGNDTNFEEILQLSAQVPVVVDIWASRFGSYEQQSPTLSGLAQSYGGKFILVTVDAEANPGLQQAFQVQQVPTVAALIKGQVMPLYSGAQPPAQVQQTLDQLIQYAAEQGLSGVAQSGEQAAAEPEPLDENHQAAFDAINLGDYEAALAAYQRALDNNPKDQDAETGLAQVGLLKRLGTQDPQEMRKAAADHPDDINVQLNVADLDIAGGHIEDAFSRLLDLFANNFGPEREELRQRLVEYFAIIGTEDERVVRARQRLASLLY